MFAVPDNTIALAEKTATRHPVRVALAYAADRDKWRGLLRYTPQQRFSALIAREEKQEIWLMSWLPGQSVDPHDHGDTEGAFTVVIGVLHETVITPQGTTTEHELAVGQSRVFGPGYLHQVSNKGVDPAVSIHVYRLGSRTIRPQLFLNAS